MTLDEVYTYRFDIEEVKGGKKEKMNNMVVLDADDMLKLLSGESVDITCGLSEVKGKNQRPLFLKMKPEMTLRDIFSDVLVIQRIFELQQRRMTEATEYWHQQNPGKENILPDLGELLHWLVNKAKV